MKTFYLITLFVALMLAPAYSQKSGKQSKEERKAELQKQTEELLNSKTFLFKGRQAYPQGGRSVNIASGPNTVNFTPDLVTCDLPFFGRSYSAAGYGSGDGGMKFEGKPETYTVEKKKKGYMVTVVVSTNNDRFSMTVNVGSEGSASLSINSNNRSPMSYSGDISQPEATR